MESVIRNVVLHSLFGIALWSAEGRRQFGWWNLKEESPCDGRRLVPMESRHVVYKLFGVLPVWSAHHTHVELPRNSAVSLVTSSGAPAYGGLDESFDHPLCKLGLDFLGTEGMPGMTANMGYPDGLESLGI